MWGNDHDTNRILGRNPVRNASALLLRPRRTVQADLRVFIKSTSASLSNRVSAPTGFLSQVIRTAFSARV